MVGRRSSIRFHCSRILDMGTLLRVYPTGLCYLVYVACRLTLVKSKKIRSHVVSLPENLTRLAESPGPSQGVPRAISSPAVFRHITLT